jgi:hypothetical protein
MLILSYKLEKKTQKIRKEYMKSIEKKLRSTYETSFSKKKS